MKTLSLFFFFTILIFPQPEHDGELILTLTNQGTSWNVTFTLTAASPRWDENYELTQDYGYVSNNATSPVFTVYFDHILDVNAGLNNPAFAMGLYRISAFENDVETAFFYMDWRTNKDGDIYFDYDVQNDIFTHHFDTESINYTYQTIWEIIDYEQDISEFEDYWDNALGMATTDTHPWPVWGPYPTDGAITEVSYYEVSRKDGGLDWVILDPAYGYNLIDDDLSLPVINYHTAQYKVRAVKTALPNNLFSGYTNISTILVNGNDPGKINYRGKGNSSVTKFELMQNYPNPFNPSTKINWQIPSDNIVTIKVFDLLGREVVILVNEFKNAGEYSVEFNGSSLPSGIYLCRIQAGIYSATRKLMLQK